MIGLSYIKTDNLLANVPCSYTKVGVNVDGENDA